MCVSIMVCWKVETEEEDEDEEVAAVEEVVVAEEVAGAAGEVMIVDKVVAAFSFDAAGVYEDDEVVKSWKVEVEVVASDHTVELVVTTVLAELEVVVDAGLVVVVVVLTSW